MARRRLPRRPALYLLAVCSISHLLVQPAAADPSAPERETARALMTDGDRLRAAGDLRAALTRYQAAHAIVHAPTTGLDLARVQAQLGLLVEARSTASEVIHHPVAPNEPAVFSSARREATTLANELESRVPAVKAEVQPSGAQYTVSIDGVSLPAEIGSLPYKVNPGPHSLRVDAPGYVTANRQVTLTDGETQTASIVLTPQPTATVSEPVTPAGAPLVAASLTGRDQDLEDRRDAARLRGLIGLSVGGAAFIAGTVTGIMTLSMGSDVKEDCKNNLCSPSQSGALSTANTLANVSNITLPIGVIGIAYGLYELLTMPSAAAKERASGAHFEFTGTGAVLRGSL
jgi:hypothetical protein